MIQYYFKKIWHLIKRKQPFLGKAYTNHYPSVQVKHKFDILDFGLNFSSELLVIAIVAVVAISNLIAFNPIKSKIDYLDKSLANNFLQGHQSLNPQLADKQNSIRTTISSEGIFSQAEASDFNQVLSSTEQNNLIAEATIDDSGISKSNPDSIQKLVSRQVQVYETQPFDTVYTVAEKFKVTPKTIRETNSLPNNALKPGWQLIIPPIDGIVVQYSNPNLTLTDIAKTYNADIKKIVSYNGLEDEEDNVDLGEYLIIPGGSLPQEKPKPQKPTDNQQQTPAKFKPAIPKAQSVSGNHKFAAGYCTDYVARKVAGIKWGGNANQWIANSKAYGATVDKNPAAGAILVTNENRRYGHVAYIEKVVGDQVYISEWNYEGLFITTHRVLDIDDSRIKGIIHP